MATEGAVRCHRLRHFLGAEQHDPHRASRPLGGVADEFRRRNDDGHAGAVVDGPGSLVPAVQVRAEQHHFLRPLAPAHVGDHVLRMRVLNIRGARVQAHTHGLPERCEPLDLIGIGAAQGKRRHRHAPIDVARRAGVRQAMAVGAHRAHQKRDRSAPRRLARAIDAGHHRRAVTGAVLRAHHAARHHGDLAAQGTCGRGLEGIEACEHHDFAFEPRGRCRRGLPERRDHQRLREGRDDLCALGAAHPGGDGEALDVHVLEAELLEARGGPFGGLPFVDGARGTRAEAARELAHPRVSDVMSGERRIAQLRRDGFRRRGRSGRCGARAERGGAQGQPAEGCAQPAQRQGGSMASGVHVRFRPGAGARILRKRSHVHH